MTMTFPIEWRSMPAKERDSGHRWKGAYVQGVLRDVCCESCGQRPIDVLRTDLTVAPCRAAALNQESR
jgi:hypothetical protein